MVGVDQEQRMELASNCNLGVGAENHMPHQILRVLRVEKRSSGKGPGRVQHFKEGIMRTVVRVGIAGSFPESDAQPRFQLWQDFRLESAFEDERVSAMLLRSPLTRLHRSPSQKIDRAGVSGNGMQAVASIRINTDVFEV